MVRADASPSRVMVLTGAASGIGRQARLTATARDDAWPSHRVLLRTHDVHGTRAAATRMVEQGHGHVVNMASLAGHCPVPGLALYAASKFAVRGLSLAAALELRPHGVYPSRSSSPARAAPSRGPRASGPASLSASLPS